MIQPQEEDKGRTDKGHSWTNFSLQDKTWTEFTSLEAAVFMLSTHVCVKQNSLA
jgi:hypothetical protein